MGKGNCRRSRQSAEQPKRASSEHSTLPTTPRETPRSMWQTTSRTPSSATPQRLCDVHICQGDKHAQVSLNIARRAASTGNYEYLTVNRPWRSSTGGASGDSRRADVIGVRCEETNRCQFIFLAGLAACTRLRFASMGRQPRLVADGSVYHALNRGNNRAAVFSESEITTISFCNPSRDKTLAAFSSRSPLPTPGVITVAAVARATSGRVGSRAR